MSIQDWLRTQLAGSFGQAKRVRDFERELQTHLEAEAQEQQESGASQQEARHAARRAFGNVGIVQEDVRAVWSFAALEQFWREIRYAARSLRKSPGFAAVAVLTLALGIGANTAIFSAVEALMLRPLVFPNAEQLVRIYSTKAENAASGQQGLIGPSVLDVRYFAGESRSFQSVVVYDIWRKNVSFADSGSEPEEMRVGLMPAGYFETLGVAPVMGRLFTDQENQPGKNFVAAISTTVWKNQYGGDAGILGRKVRINDEPYTIVAVMPAVIPQWMEPWGPGPVEIWTPFVVPESLAETSRGARGDAAIARMKPGVTLAQAQADLTTIAAALAAAHPVDKGVGVAVRPIADTRVGQLRPMLYLLVAAVAVILLIACVNLASLLLARNSARQRELAVRAALGAGRAGLVRHLLAETLVLSLSGGAVGALLANIAVTSLAKAHPGNMPQLSGLKLDASVLVFTLVVSVATSLLFGVAPALSGTRLDLVDALKQGARAGNAGPGSQRLRGALVVAEMAMSLMLLVGATLLVQSILRLDHQQLGIRQDHLLKGHIYVPGAHYPDPGAIARFCDAFGAQVRALPGVVDASVTTLYPPNDGWMQMLGIPGRPATRVEDIPTTQFGVADAHFLKTLGVPLMEGRDFAESDSATSRTVALINEEFRKRYFAAEDPLGREVHIGPPAFLQIPPGAMISDAADVTIVGVMGDFRNAGLALPPEPQIVVLYAQHPLVNYGFKDLVVRTAGEPHAIAPAIRSALHELDADMPFAEVMTMEELVEAQTGGERFTTIFLASFAVAGLALAAVGIYGVVSFLAAQRKQELAVRLALGASRGSVLWIVLKQSLVMAAVGAGIGLLGAFAGQKLMKELLFGVSPLDPATFTAAAIFLVGIAAAAGVIPGARVMRIDPARTLRQE